MRKYLLLFCAVLTLLVCYCGGAVYAEKEIDIVLNGQTLLCDSPPQIRNDRTVVPISSIVKPLGGTADFNGVDRTVTVTVSGKSILFTIDSTSVLVNGTAKQLDTPAIIINDRTMIPVRFLAEELGYNVRWDGTSRTVYIDTPETKQISDVWVTKSDNSVTISIQANSDLSGYTIDDFKNPERTVIDFPGFALGRNFQETIDADGFSGLRSGNHDNYARLVVDLTKAVSYTQKLQNGNTRLDIQYSISSSQNGSGGTQIPPKTEGKIRVVIDAGHGGTDPGSLGKDENGNIVLEEKDPNLTIATGVHNVLAAAGFDVIMTRYDDTYPSLKQRADIANNYDADIFVSIHNNASTDPTVSGTMTFYSGPKDEAGIGKYNSQELADYIQTELVQSLGTRDLNVREGHEYYVINKTDMTAVLVEVSFVSNEEECTKLMDENYLNLAARAIANGIMKATGMM